MNEQLNNLIDDWMRNAADTPEFDKAGRVHDWRNHVPEKVQLIWTTLSEETRLALVLVADDEAGQEDWD